MEQWEAAARWYTLDRQAHDAQIAIKSLTTQLWEKRDIQLRAAVAGQPGAMKGLRAIDGQLAKLAEQAAAVKGQIAEIQALGAQLGTYCEVCDLLGRPCSACSYRARKAAQTPGGAVRFAPGGAVKALSDTRVRALGIVWGGEDAVGDQFVRGVTDLGMGARHQFAGLPVFYDHAQGGIKSQIGVVVYADENEEGIDFEIELDRANGYFEKVKRLIQLRKLGSSTGALAHTVVRRAGKLLRWQCGELSLLPEPCEPRTMGRVRY